MSNNRLRLDGLDDLRAALRKLPADLTQEASGIVTSTAEDAAAEIVSNYPVVTGALKRGVRVAKVTSGFIAGASVKNTAPHAYIFEHGSQTRKTRSGTPNPMPPGRVFIPIVVRKRRAMNGRLIALVRREGFEVSGG